MQQQEYCQCYRGWNMVLSSAQTRYRSVTTGAHPPERKGRRTRSKSARRGAEEGGERGREPPPPGAQAQ